MGTWQPSVLMTSILKEWMDASSRQQLCLLPGKERMEILSVSAKWLGVGQCQAKPLQAGVGMSTTDFSNRNPPSEPKPSQLQRKTEDSSHMPQTGRRPWEDRLQEPELRQEIIVRRYPASSLAHKSRVLPALGYSSSHTPCSCFYFHQDYRH